MVLLHCLEKMTCSDPLSALELKSPFEYTAIAQLMGLSVEKAHAVISENIFAALAHGGRKGEHGMESSSRETPLWSNWSAA